MDEEKGGEAAQEMQPDAIEAHESNINSLTLFLDGLAALSCSELPNLKAESDTAQSRFTGMARPK
jgi:hypothetical protein